MYFCYVLGEINLENSRIIPHDYLQKHVLARYMKHQDCFYLYFKKELLKKFRTLPAIDQDAVILANLNINDSDSNHKSDASSPNDSMEESQYMEEQDYSKVLIQKSKILKMNRIIK